MRLIDTHCHLNLAEYFPDLSSAIERARDAGVDRIIAIGIDLETSRRAVDLAATHPGIYATVGIHPNSSRGLGRAWLSEIEALAKEPRVVAIGEIGLDYHWDRATKDEQLDALNLQLDLARRLEMPVVFHCREAYRDLLDLLNQCERPQSTRWLLHCFAGDDVDARQAVELGCWFGVDGPVTYPKAVDLRSVVSTLPRDRIVIETDAPFLTPVPYRGKPNEPAYIRYVNVGLARVLEIGEQECAELTTRNAEVFFGLES